MKCVAKKTAKSNSKKLYVLRTLIYLGKILNETFVSVLDAEIQVDKDLKIHSLEYFIMK